MPSQMHVSFGNWLSWMTSATCGVRARENIPVLRGHLRELNSIWIRHERPETCHEQRHQTDHFACYAIVSGDCCGLTLHPPEQPMRDTLILNFVGSFWEELLNETCSERLRTRQRRSRHLRRLSMTKPRISHRLSFTQGIRSENNAVNSGRICPKVNRRNS